jgi:hypothetical protein
MRKILPLVLSFLAVINVVISIEAAQGTAKTIGTLTTVTTSNELVVIGTPVTVTANVVALKGKVVPTGTVKFTVLTTQIGEDCTLDANGTCSIIYTWNGKGEYPIVATFTGTGDFLDSVSAAKNQVVTRRTSSTTVVSSRPVALLGDPLTFTTTVTSPSGIGGTPTGSIILYAYESNTVIGTCTLSAGSCQIDLAASTAGNHRVWASYSGDDIEYLPSNSPYIYQLNSTKVVPTVTVTTSPSPSNFGELVTLTATVAGSAGMPTGVVRFEDNEATLANCTLDAAGTCSVTTTTFAPGSHTIVAEIGETSVYAGAEGSITHTVNQLGVATSTAVQSSSNPVKAGKNFNILVSVTSSAGVPTGSVEISNGASLIGTCTLVIGACQLTTSFADGGVFTVTAHYLGVTGTYLPSSHSYSQEILGASGSGTTTTISSSGSSATVGDPVTLTSLVIATDTATGSIAFKDNGVDIATCTLVASTCSLTHTFTSVGTHSVTATYLPAGNLKTSVGTLLQVINKRTSTFFITATPNPAPRLKFVHFEISLHSSATGPIWVEDGEMQKEACAALVAGHCTLDLAFSTLGVHNLQFEYSGDALNSDAAVFFPVTVGQNFPTVTLTSDKAPAEFYQSINFTANLSDTSATGTVQFFADGVGMQSCVIQAGTCTSFFYRLSVGTHSVVAVYSGDTMTAGATSPALTQIVIPAATTTTIASSEHPFAYGAGLALTGTVTNGGAGPTGAIQFEDVTSTPEVILGTCELAGASSCILVLTTPLSIGNHTLVAEYVSDGNYAGSKSAQLSQEISKPTASVAVVSSKASAKLGEAVTLTVNVAPNGSPATGTAQFKDGNENFGPVLDLVSGSASITTSTLTAGAHNISAIYSGDVQHNQTTSAVLVQTILYPVSVSMSIDPVTLAFADTTIISTKVSSAYGDPEGVVVIEEELPNGADIVLGSCTLTTQVCTHSLSTLAVGTHEIYVEYGGQNNFASGASRRLLVTVTPRPVISTPVQSAPKTPTQSTAPILPPTPKLTPDSPLAVAISGSTASSLTFTEIDALGRESLVSVSVPVGAITGSATLLISKSLVANPNAQGLIAFNLAIASTDDAAVKRLLNPIVIKISRQGTTGKPAISEDSVNWMAIAAVSKGVLTSGVTTGYFVTPGKSVELLTLLTGTFDILKTQNLLSIKSTHTIVKVGTQLDLTTRGGTGLGTVTYKSLTPSICSINSLGVATMLAKGTCSVIANKSSDDNYLSATSKPKEFKVNP